METMFYLLVLMSCACMVAGEHEMYLMANDNRVLRQGYRVINNEIFQVSYSDEDCKTPLGKSSAAEPFTSCRPFVTPDMHGQLQFFHTFVVKNETGEHSGRVFACVYEAVDGEEQCEDDVKNIGMIIANGECSSRAVKRPLIEIHGDGEASFEVGKCVEDSFGDVHAEDYDGFRRD